MMLDALLPALEAIIVSAAGKGEEGGVIVVVVVVGCGPRQCTGCLIGGMGGRQGHRDDEACQGQEVELPLKGGLDGDAGWTQAQLPTLSSWRQWGR
jgi:hypothetical protein